MKPTADRWPRPAPVPFENVLRWWVYSHTTPRKTYLVELDAYHFNGRCTCKDFVCNLEPLLRRNLTPQHAFEGELVHVKPGKRPEDCLRCIHILDAIAQFAEDFGRAVKRTQTEPPLPTDHLTNDEQTKP